MKRLLLQSISITGLALTLLPAILVFTGALELTSHKWLMMLGTVLWFGATPFWINQPAE